MPVKSLGIYFGRNAGKYKKLNFDKQYDKSEKLLNNWTKRNLTIIGKITVVKSLIFLNLTFLASVTHIDKSNMNKFNTLIYHMNHPYIKPFHKFSNKTHVT